MYSLKQKSTKENINKSAFQTLRTQDDVVLTFNNSAWYLNN